MLNFITMNKAMVRVVQSDKNLKHFAILAFQLKSIRNRDHASGLVETAFSEGHLDLARELIREEHESDILTE